MLRSLLCLVSFAALTGCGPVKVNYAITCVASCPTTGTDANVNVTVCELDGQDPNTIAAANVASCVANAKANCPDVTCACQAVRSTTVCN